MKHFYAIESIFILKNLVAYRAGEDQGAAAGAEDHPAVGGDGLVGGVGLACQHQRTAATYSSVTVGEDVVHSGGLEDFFHGFDDPWGEMGHAAGEVHHFPVFGCFLNICGHFDRFSERRGWISERGMSGRCSCRSD